jgi:NAD(P)-dependent dehydrogenase (short-subunit alcohol dehydrogenase family)
MTFRGNVALVTGAASGMGQLSAWRLAADGVRVAALDVNEGGLSATARRAPSVQPYVCDVSKWDDVEQVVAQVEADLGPIDRVVNAAAIAPTANLLEQSVDEIRRLTEINYLGSVHVVKATLPLMIERGHGDLIQFASPAGWLPSQHFGAYSATKFAVVAFSETLYYENKGSGVRICCVCPPIVDTPLLEQVRRGAQKLLDASPPIQPETVLDAIERGLDRGHFFVYPGPATRVIVLLRRWFPGVLWKRLEALEAEAEGESPPAATPTDPATPIAIESDDADAGAEPASV